MLLGIFPASAVPVEAATVQAFKTPKPKFSTAKAFDVSPALRDLAVPSAARAAVDPSVEPLEVRPDRGPEVKDTGFSGDGAVGADFALRA